LADIAGRFGTPCYVYSRAAIEHNWKAYDSAFGQRDHLICYAIKANSSLAVINLLARLGSGFDVVSVGELERVLRAGGEADRIVFSGVGKREDEMQRALVTGIRCFNIESLSELERLNRVARGMNTVAPVAVRVNPGVDAATHPYIATGLEENKFGVPIDEALAVYRAADGMEAIMVTGVDCHIGSQITSIAPFSDAIGRLLPLIDAIEDLGIKLCHIDVGGGLGISYRGETPPAPADLVGSVLQAVGDRPYRLILEPGRSIIGSAGVLLARVEYIKRTPSKNFAIVDAAMNDLLRPALYQAWHDILPVREQPAAQAEKFDVVGPVCETGDFLGRDRELPLREGDLVAICSTGAYGFCMSSTYNSRPRACEVMVDGGTVHEIRRRETLDELMTGESVLPA